jgi:hypothetical protein
MLKWWKRKVTSSYVTWSKKTHKLDKLPEEVTKVKWKEGWFELNKEGKKVWRKQRLIWEDATGKINYRAWWRQ